MRELIDKPEWVSEQYADDRNLNARIAMHKRFSTSDVSWPHWVVDRIAERVEGLYGAQGPLTILELGTGPATTWAENAGRIPAGWRLLLSDLSPGMVVSARRNLGEAGVAADLLVAGAEQIPIATASCHAVIANHMLYHVTDRRRALEEIRRVLLPGGVLIAATNGEGHMRELHELAHRFDPAYLAEDPVPRKFSLESGERELGDHFAEVAVVHKENLLVVTEAGPLVAYMMSGSPTAVPPEMETKLRAFVGAELAEKGVIRIQPVTGLLVAQGPHKG